MFAMYISHKNEVDNILFCVAEIQDSTGTFSKDVFSQGAVN